MRKPISPINTPGGTSTLALTAYTQIDGSGTKNSESTFSVLRDFINNVILSVSATVFSNPANGYVRAYALADPIIQIDPTAMIDVGGTLYPASELYALEFSPGFSGTPVPEPSSFALLGIGAIGLAIGATRRRRARTNPGT